MSHSRRGSLAAPANVGALGHLEVSVSSIERTRGLVAYAERVRSRPAYQEAKAIDNALIAEMQAAKTE